MPPFQCLVVGVAGGTGSGKTTVARELAEALPDGRAHILEYDAYYREQSLLSDEERAEINYDHPDALESELLAQQVQQLRSGEVTEIPVYDFVLHNRAKHKRRLEPRPVLIVEGIMALAVPCIRELFDIKIFVDTDADLRVFRRIRRDIEQRGRSFNLVREQYYNTVRPMHMEFVEPSKRFADLIVPEGGSNRVALEVLVARLQRDLA
ncbi:MAG: uridine kinase [Myxococcales bacterium]|nr:uridine kinase [Myxococcales bacterium]